MATSGCWARRNRRDVGSDGYTETGTAASGRRGGVACARCRPVFYSEGVDGGAVSARLRRAAVAGQLGIDGTVLTGAEFGAMSEEEALAKVDGVGVIARVSPGHKVRLVDVLRKKGQIVAMTGDGVNDAPAVEKADIGIAMGTGTEVTQEAAVMILTDDNFSTIVKAVELGRGLYDNLARYIRFQIGGLFGYIATFLGASIFNVAEGIPLLPLQTLWVSFTMLSIQSVGLGYSKPAAGLMERPPLPPSRPILTRALSSSGSPLPAC